MACRRRYTLKFVTLVCFISVLIYSTFELWRKTDFQLLINGRKYARYRLKKNFITTGNQTSIADPNVTDTPITLFVRMAGKLEKHRQRYYCDLFRSTVLFWPPSYGKTVMVLDEESVTDHVFTQNITRQTKEHFPEYKLEVLYEPLPKDPSILDFPGSPRPPGYNRQLWSSFFIDLYTNDTVIGWMDNDAAFFTSVTKSSIFRGTKLRVLGWECSMVYSWVRRWAKSTKLALGLPFVVDFMTYFPVYIYRDTFTHCREYILKRFNTTSFEEAFKAFYKGKISPVSVILSYAWYFEKGRYDWNFKICSDITKYNKQFPVGHKIGPEHIEDILSEPQTAFHASYGKFLYSNVLVSFCLSHRAAGNELAMCSKHNFSLSDNFDLLHHDLQRVRKLDKNPCAGKNTNLCLQVLERHYKQVGLEMKKNERKLDWHNVETVEKLANEVDIKCKPIR